MKHIHELHADVCKTLANAKRIEIINLLRSGEKSVSWLIEKTGLLKANLSQHLSLMRRQGIIKARKERLNVFYRISNPKIVRACDLMREVLFEQMEERKEAFKKWKQLL